MFRLQKAIEFAPDGDSGDQIFLTSQRVTDVIVDVGKMDREGKRENSLSFEHHIISKIHELKI